MIDNEGELMSEALSHVIAIIVWAAIAFGVGLSGGLTIVYIVERYWEVL